LQIWCTIPVAGLFAGLLAVGYLGLRLSWAGKERPRRAHDGRGVLIPVTFSHTIRGRTYRFDSLKAVLAKASPLRSGDTLAGIAADSDLERAAAKFALADVPLTMFLIDAVIPYEDDDVSRLIFDTHDQTAFAPISHLTVGQLREWIVSEERDADALASVAAGLTPEMVAAVSKLMRNQDLILAARKCRVVTRFRNTLGLPGRMSVRLQPNHPTDDLQ
jgi:ethanolamine ammonia-lyase large subunit